MPEEMPITKFEEISEELAKIIAEEIHKEMSDWVLKQNAAGFPERSALSKRSVGTVTKEILRKISIKLSGKFPDMPMQSSEKLKKKIESNSAEAIIYLLKCSRTWATNESEFRTLFFC